MGIDSNFVLPVKDHLSIFTCSLCTKMVSLDGYVTIPCHHSFCMDCFTEWMAKIHKKSQTCDCPNCGVSILTNSKSSTEKLFKQNVNLSSVLVRPLSVAQPLVHRMLGQVKVLCPCRGNTSFASFCSWTGDYASLDHHASTFHKTAKVSVPEKSSSPSPATMGQIKSEESRAIQNARGRAMERVASQQRASSMPRSQDQTTSSQTKSMSDLKKTRSTHRRLLPSDRSESKSCHPRCGSSDGNLKTERTNRTSRTGIKSSSRLPVRSRSSDDGGDVGKSSRSSRSRRKSGSRSPQRSTSKAQTSRSPMRTRDSLKSSDGLDLQEKLLEELKLKASKRSSKNRSESELKRRISKDSSHSSISEYQKIKLLEELKRSTSKGHRRRPESKQPGLKISKNASISSSRAGDQKRKLLEELKRSTSRGACRTRPEAQQQVPQEMNQTSLKEGSIGSNHRDTPKRASRGMHPDSKSISTLRRSERHSSSRSPCREDEKKPSIKQRARSPKETKKSTEKRQQPPPPPPLATKQSELSTFALDIKEKANTVFNEGKYQDAVDLFTEAIDKYSFSVSQTGADKELVATLYGNRAAGYLKQGLFVSCLNDSDCALLLNPHLPRVCLRKVWALKEMGRFEQACTSLTKGLLDNPGVKELEEEMAYTLTLLQEFEELECLLARREYEKVKLALSSMSLTINRAVLMEVQSDLGLGNADDAIATLNAKILSIDITNAVALELLAQAHFQNGDLDESIQAAKSARRYQGKLSNLETYESVQMSISDGRSALDQRNFEEAIQAYSSAIDRTTQGPPNAVLRLVLLTERARAYLLDNKLEESLEDSNEILAWDKGSVAAWTTRVETFHALRDYSSIARELGPVVGKLGNKFLRDAYQESLESPDHDADL